MNLARNIREVIPGDAIGMALEANLVLEMRVFHRSPGAVQPAYEPHRVSDGYGQNVGTAVGNVRAGGHDGMRVVAIGAFDMASLQTYRFFGIVTTLGGEYGMGAALAQFAFDVGYRHAAAMAIQAVVLLARKAQQTLRGTGRMNLVATSASVLGDGVKRESFGRVDIAIAYPRGAERVAAVFPPEQLVAAQANGGAHRGLTEKISEAVVVGIVAGCTVHFAVGTERESPREDVRVLELAVTVGECAVKTKSNGMIVGQVFRQISRAGWNRAEGSDDWISLRTRRDQSECHRAVMAAEAHLGRSAGLVYARVGGTALIDAVVHIAVEPVPERGLTAGIVRGVAEDAHLLFIERVDSTGTGRGQIVR